MVKGRAIAFRAILGDSFDVIGFDPRGSIQSFQDSLESSPSSGVGRTTPHLNIFETALEAGTIMAQHEGSFNASPSALGRAYAFVHNLGDMALKRAEKVAHHVSTPVVARDMLSIAHAAGQEKLQYWGFSCVAIPT